MPEEIDCDYTDEIVCPHCGYEHSDSWEAGEDGAGECGSCGEEYHFTRNINVDYCTVKIFCRRDGHKWKKPQWMWEDKEKNKHLWSRMCSECDGREQGYDPEWAPTKTWEQAA